MTKKQWWKEAVAYEIYPRSFKDSNGDGIGDIPGIIEKLDYLKELGIDVIWICPIYESPNDDNGYDISDYHDILNDFGTMEDFDLLLKEAHKREMKLIMDLVINHTSDEHEWFVESRSSKDNPYRNYYIWHPGEKEKPANNWASIFGGSIWEYDEKTGEYYMHVFSKKQPDLNWENKNVRESLYKMVNWWLDKGIDGFRIDAISHIKKLEGFPDLPNPDGRLHVPSFEGHRNRPGIDLFLSEFVKNTFNHYDVMTVGEANGVKVEEADKWVDEESGYFDMIFQFEHVDLWGEKGDEGLDLPRLKHTLSKWQKGLDGRGWNALFIENHDLPRVVSLWGDDKKYRKESAKAFGLLYFFMQGTPFIYQGQEIGMTNVRFETINDYRDVAIKNYYSEQVENGKEESLAMEYIWNNGRDNSRTPMQWSDEEQAGFTTGIPWLKVNSNYRTINVKEAKEDSDSIYHFYREMIQMKKSIPALIYGHYELIAEDHPKVFAYIREYEGEHYVVLANLFKGETGIDLSEEMIFDELLLANYEVDTPEETVISLRPFEARLYKVAEQKIWHDPNQYQ